MRRVLSCLLLATAVYGCNSKVPEEGRIPLDQIGQTPATKAGDVLTGTVLEQLPAGQYVYLRLKTATGEVWAAVNQTPVKVGEQVTIPSPMLMKKFESTALQRTFDEVYFGALAQGGAAAAVAVENPHAGGPQSIPAANVGKVEKAGGADARTVAEAWAQKSSLEGKTVTIRGVVVKLNEAVMGKNWLHLQDGSGDAAQGTNDITVVTTDQTAKGETVTVTGTVRTNKDIGAGYVFPVLIEDAKVVKK